MPKWTFREGHLDGKTYRGSSMVDDNGKPKRTGKLFGQAQKLAKARLNHARIISCARRVPPWTGPAYLRSSHVDKGVLVDCKVQLLPGNEVMEWCDLPEALPHEDEPSQEVTWQYGLKEGDYIKLRFLNAVAAQWQKMEEYEIRELSQTIQKYEDKKMAASDPSPAKHAQEMGNEAFKAGDFNRAVLLYSEGIELDGANAALYNNRAMAYLSLGRHRESIEDCTAALQLQPMNVKALLRRAHAYRLSHQGSSSNLRVALADLKRVLALEPHNKAALGDASQIESQLAKENHANSDKVA
ncbi:hypothetical protein CYMTET_38594 [Cymbomonas tetramitiformis]|uniref:Uncharacterized protein n=1 Tax=Cymbomonas tetramitiformis TaxID=36881 RepID=A0AAE0CD53_9CHLO|nr:hypothetical protein CYMTET_38594 [Cymbomonas tetramitiformis]KAK3252095.1 hypothetical protein CYMTET_38594 [Cymbomonas tetramitiformis]